LRRGLIGGGRGGGNNGTREGRREQWDEGGEEGTTERRREGMWDRNKRRGKGKIYWRVWKGIKGAERVGGMKRRREWEGMKGEREWEGGEELIRMEESWRGVIACNLPSAHAAQMFFPTALHMRNGRTCHVRYAHCLSHALPCLSSAVQQVPCHRRC